MKFLNRITWLLTANLFIYSHLHAEAIALKDVGYFQVPSYTTLVVQAPSKNKPTSPATTAGSTTTLPNDTSSTAKPSSKPNTTSTTAESTTAKPLLVKMPTDDLTNVIPASARTKTKKGKNPPAGVIPIARHPKTGKMVAGLAYENGNFKGISDFGGSGDDDDDSIEATAAREFIEETCLAFLLSLPEISHMTGAEIMNAVKSAGTAGAAKGIPTKITATIKELIKNLRPWIYTFINKYSTYLLPVPYQSPEAIAKTMEVVRNKVSSLNHSEPFFEKTGFVWIPLEDLIEWLENDTESPAIKDGNGKSMAWRFIGSMTYFKGDPTRVNTNTSSYDIPGLPKFVRDRTIKYLKDIIALNS